MARTLILLCAGAAPILAIPAHVFGIVPIHLAALRLIVPITLLSLTLLVWRPKPHDRVVIGGFLAGLIAVAAYDAFRLLTVYGLHWWGDFSPSWVDGSPTKPATPLWDTRGGTQATAVGSGSCSSRW
ncbi:MAG: hypothetical protein H0V41_19330 [Pseudonocardiales bacterium]|nr:hypothetical protein [Pseudonocardiales bacterium]